jgi:hypothetical protein
LAIAETPGGPADRDPVLPVAILPSVRSIAGQRRSL